MDSPLISCLCVTRGKPQLLMRAIKCFFAQVYLNKELIIVYESNDFSTKEVCEREACDQVRILEVPESPKRTLGYLRNRSIEAANGEFICQWDDDDWYHANRLNGQFNAIRKSDCKGCIVSRWIVYDSLQMKAYLSHVRLWEGSLLCRKSAIEDTAYLDKSIGEDTAVIEYLHKRREVYAMEDGAKLYIYVYHGGNTWHREHWEEIFRAGEELPANTSDLIVQILNQNMTVAEGSFSLDRIFKC